MSSTDSDSGEYNDDYGYDQQQMWQDEEELTVSPMPKDELKDGELVKKFDKLTLEMGDQKIAADRQNVLLIWNLPPVINLDRLRREFIWVCEQKVSGSLDVISAKVHHRTFRAERRSQTGGLSKSGSTNALICSYMILTIGNRDHAQQLINVWNGNSFQGRRLSVKFSNKDRCASA